MEMVINGQAERILVLAPVGQDGPLTCRVLAKSGLRALACAGMEQLCQELHHGAGAILLTEEALDADTTLRLLEVLRAQPSWSDLPLVVLTRHGGAHARLVALKSLEPLGNVTFLERPLRTMTLVSTLRMTLRARRRQYEICELLRRLEEDMRRRDDFLAMLAHELRNPLAPIRNAVKLLRMHHRIEPQKVVWATDLLDRQSQQLNRMVDDLLDMSRIQRGKITLKRELVDLNQVLERAIEASRPLIEERRHQLSLSVPEQPLPVYADVVRLAQAITNLLNNAAKFSEEGGLIELTTRRSDRYALISVRDQGIGIVKDLLPRIFEPFTQGARVGQSASGGLGLGLAVVQKLVELHGGSVEAHSEGPGQGSTFVIRMPLHDCPSAEAPANPSSGAPRARRTRRVLIVEDNRDAADSLKLLLTLAGHDVHVVYDAATAIANAPLLRPDVMLIDIGLPDMDGYQLARHLRQYPAIANSILVAVTGFGQEEDRRRSAESGFNAHCVKPVDVNTLESLFDLGPPFETAQTL